MCVCVTDTVCNVYSFAIRYACLNLVVVVAASSLLSTTGQLVLVFTSDRSVSGAGFSAKFKAIDLAMDCDRTFTASSGQIDFNSRDYAQGVGQCDFHIVLQANHRILLKVVNISAPCGHSSLMIRWVRPSPFLARFQSSFGLL